jgi:serine/threonine protein phosphatase 1
MLGDYIDRGADSRSVIDALLALSPDKFELVFLRGNHEAAMLGFPENPETGPYWLRIGGDQALMSYGVAPFTAEASPETLAAASQALAAALPPAHLEFLQSLKVSAQYGDYVFVHAGLRPGKALEAQSEEDLISIRKDFLKSNARWPFVVVHGHSPVQTGYRDERRIAVDTAAYATGKLSAVRLDGEDVSFIST